MGAFMPPSRYCTRGRLVVTSKARRMVCNCRNRGLYIRPSTEGMTLTANGKVVKRGKSIAHMEGEIRDSEGRLIATAKGTWAIWKVD